MNEALAASQTEVQRLNEEREKYEETMKKAFMRGVCALNLEAMSMFQNEEGTGQSNFDEFVLLIVMYTTLYCIACM